jgi:arsenate reductase
MLLSNGTVGESERKSMVSARYIALNESGCCATIATPLDETGASALARGFAALADPVRLRLLNLLATADAGEVCVCDLTGPVGKSQPTVSHHLKILADAGLISGRKEGRWVQYRLVPERLADLRATLEPPGSRSTGQAEAAVTTLPKVLFVCIHNAGRSQMAAALLNHYTEGRAQARSAGSSPATEVNPSVVTALAEVDIDIAGRTPRQLTDDMVASSDIIVTMGCGDACPVFPGKQYRDWKLDDPAGQGVAAVRAIRDQIDQLVRDLLAEVAPAVAN